MECRRCKAMVYDNGKKVPVEGWFHEWGCDYEEFDSGPANFSVAIIELDNGKIVEALPCSVVFLAPLSKDGR